MQIFTNEEEAMACFCSHENARMVNILGVYIVTWRD